MSVTDPLHAKRVEVAQALSGIAAYSKDPRVEAIAVFSKPVAEFAVSIGEEVERQVNAGVKSRSTDRTDYLQCLDPLAFHGRNIVDVPKTRGRFVKEGGIVH